MVWSWAAGATATGRRRGGRSKGFIRHVTVALDYVEEGWDQPAPYQVELEDGTLIFAPIDEDWVIRKQLKASK